MVSLRRDEARHDVAVAGDIEDDRLFTHIDSVDFVVGEHLVIARKAFYKGAVFLTLTQYIR